MRVASALHVDYERVVQEVLDHVMVNRTTWLTELQLWWHMDHPQCRERKTWYFD